MQRVFVGDVQGCADELDELLGRAEAAWGEGFELWAVGDVVNRGPHNLRALRRVRELVDAGRGHCVLGNHELNLLYVAAGLRELAPLDTISDVLEAPDAADWIEWLRQLPLAVTGTLGRRAFALVHAAVHPAWSLADVAESARACAARLGGGSWSEAAAFLAGDRSEDADLDAVQRFTGCRSVGAGDAWSPAVPELAPAGYRAWHEAWSDQGHAYGVVYGHWSLQGLHMAGGLRGLDTGCVHHGRGRDGFLTAWIPDPGGEDSFPERDDAFWQVRARRAYYAHKDSAPPRPFSD